MRLSYRRGRNAMYKNRMMIKSLLITTLIVASVAVTQPAAGQKTGAASAGREQLELTVREAYDKYKSDTSGKNADYIPYLAQVDSKLFGVAVVTAENKTFSLGETSYAFSIQSISKVYTLALAMEELGFDKVFERVGSEPT